MYELKCEEGVIFVVVLCLIFEVLFEDWGYFVFFFVCAYEFEERFFFDLGGGFEL